MQTEDNKLKFVESVCDWHSHNFLFGSFWSFYSQKILTLNIVFQIFSFVFGDGDPNQGIEEERWKLVIIEY